MRVDNPLKRAKKKGKKKRHFFRAAVGSLNRKEEKEEDSLPIPESGAGGRPAEQE